MNTHKRVFKTLTVLTLWALILSTVTFFVPMQTSTEIFADEPYVQRNYRLAEVELTNVSTLKADVKALMNTAFDSMYDEFSYKVTGDAALGFFFEVSGGKPTTNLKSNMFQDVFQGWLEENLYDMRANNENAYARIAIESWKFFVGYTYQGGNALSLTATYQIDWLDSDGTGAFTALDAKNYVKSQAQAFLNSSAYPSSGSDDAKLNAINKHINQSFQYDYRVYANPELAIHSAYKMLKDPGHKFSDMSKAYPRGVCQAYTLYGYIMLKLAGYESIVVTGDAGQGTPGPHTWNMVKVGSYWYHLDFTWNDPVRTDNPPPQTTRQKGDGTLSVSYFMKTDAYMAGKWHYWEASEDGYTYPNANKEWTVGGVTPTPAPKEEPPPVPTTAPTVAPTAPPTMAPQPTSQPTSSPTPSQSAGSSESDDLSDSSSLDADSSISSDDTSSQGSSTGSVSVGSGAGDQTLDQDKSSKSDPDSHGGSDSSIVDGLEDSGEGPKKEETIRISGILRNELGEPMPNMRMELFSTGQTVITDKNGYYQFDDVKSGSYKIQLYENDEFVTELPIIISGTAEKTAYSSGIVSVKGDKLSMDLIYDNENLSQVHNVGVI